MDTVFSCASFLIMNDRQVDQLDKVLALVDSTHEGEAVGAVRMARQILSRDGLNFSDLARAASSKSTRFSLPRALFSGQVVHLEAQIAQLQQALNDLRDDNQSLRAQLEFWHRRSFEMEQQLNISQSDAQRWKQLARETAEKLWDISQIARQTEWSSGQPSESEENEPAIASTSQGG